MRDMILNDLSMSRSSATIYDLRPLWKETSKGMGTLVNEGICTRLLRMSKTWDQYRCKGDKTLHDLILMAVKERSEDLDEFRFLLSLSSKVPLDLSLSDETVRRISGCEAEELDGEGGECLLICALILGVAVSVPLEQIFDKDSLVVRFRETVGEAEIRQIETAVDNVCRSHHANAISQRYRASILGSVDLNNLWEKKGEVFPHLRFGGDVEQQLGLVSTTSANAVIQKLSELDDTVKEWQETQSQHPNWRSEVTPESSSVMRDAHLRECRRFASYHGGTKIFEWHAKTAGQRVHLIFDAKSREIEIGYIGKHLPLH